MLINVLYYEDIYIMYKYKYICKIKSEIQLPTLSLPLIKDDTNSNAFNSLPTFEV